LLPAVVLATGILSARFVNVELTSLIVPAALAAGAICLSRFLPAARRIRPAAIFFVIGLTGMATQILHRPGRTPTLNAQDADTVLLSGCVVNPPVFSPDREQFTLALAPKASIRLNVALKNAQTLPLAYGQLVEVAAKIRSPRNFQNPDAFDYVGYLASQHIYWNGSVSSPGDIHTLPGACGFRALGWLFDIRTWALGRLASLYPGDQHTAGLLQATLLGETNGIERRWTGDFRVTGTYHAIVISGLHVSVLAASVLLILRLLPIGRFSRLWIACSATWMYAFISGLNSPAVRCAAGFTLFVLGSCFFRRCRPLNMLAAIGMVYLIAIPSELFDAAFQLSFLSCAAIAAFAVPMIERYTQPAGAAIKRFDQVPYDPQVEERAAGWRVELRLLAETLRAWTGLSLRNAQRAVCAAVVAGVFIANMLIVSACMQFALALPMVSYFHRLSVTGLSANLIVVPLLLLVVPLGFATIVTGWHPLAFLTALLLHWAEASATWHARFEPAWRIAAIPLWVALAFSVSLILLGFTIRRGRRFIIPAFAASFVLFGILCLQPWQPVIRPGTLEVTAIDVGQGDSLLLVFPNGKTMLLDAGGFPGMERMAHKPQIDMGEDVVSPYLWSRRIHRIDYAVLSHGHSDHMAGLPAILDNFRPGTLWVGAEPETAEWETVRRHAAADHVGIVPLHRGSPDITIGGVRIRVLAPSPDYQSGDHPANDDSLVLGMTYGKRSVLLTGDAERPVEDDMVASGLLHPVTLLKVGHHGSRTSSSEAFLDQLSPQFAIISDGYMNQFHHPHQIVLDRLTERHADILRTDQRGLITFWTDGDKVEIATFH
jgi:competence protein ComEC